MNAAQRQTEPVAVFEELEQRILLSGDVLAGAFVAEPFISGGDLNNVAITAGLSWDNTSTGGDVGGALAAAATVSMLTETHPAPTQTVGQFAQGLLGNGDEPTSFNEYFPETEEDNMLGRSDGGTDLMWTLDSSPQTLTLFDGDAGSDWNTSDLAGQSTFADASAPGFATIELEF
jgi:hypothetical protein